MRSCECTKCHLIQEVESLESLEICKCGNNNFTFEAALIIDNRKCYQAIISPPREDYT